MEISPEGLYSDARFSFDLSVGERDEDGMVPEDWIFMDGPRLAHEGL